MVRAIARIAVIAVVATIGLFLWLAPRSEPSSVPAQAIAEAPKPKPPPTPRVDKSDFAQKKRAELIGKLISQRVFMKIEMPGNLPRLWVGPRFAALDFDTKSSFVSVVYAYHFDGTDISDTVRVFDGRTGKEMGSFTITEGLSLY